VDWQDLSMTRKFDNAENVDDTKLGTNAFVDMTDKVSLLK
jgi:hypothetical protein